MGAGLAFWKSVVNDRSDFLERVIALLEDNDIRYCVIGGVAVNAYVAPVVTEDLDIVVATDQLGAVRRLASEHFRVREFPFSLNVYDPDSNLQVQFQLQPGVADFVQRSVTMPVLGLELPVAALPDLIGAKVAAAQDATRRGSKRQKDLADILRLLEAFPDLRPLVPQDILVRLFL